MHSACSFRQRREDAYSHATVVLSSRALLFPRAANTVRKFLDLKLMRTIIVLTLLMMPDCEEAVKLMRIPRRLLRLNSAHF